MKQNRKKGFTLLEIIIVIIIIGVMAALALPRFFQLIEYSRSAEAVTNLSVLRNSMERCYLQTQDLQQCDALDLADLDVGNPSGNPGTHFNYALPSDASATTYSITATRNTFDGGDGTSTITLTYTDGTVTLGGTGDFQGVK